MAKFTPQNRLFHDYDAFVDKFQKKPQHKMTTDDCYTPDVVYDAVLNWARTLQGFPQDANIVRPFWPGAHYDEIEYCDNDVVVDNPPFSILAQIVKFYQRYRIPFMLFAPTLTLFNLTKDMPGVTALPTDVSVTYHNGAVVNTSFVTNMDDPDIAIRVSQELFMAVGDACRVGKRMPTKIEYPDCVCSAALLNKISNRCVPLIIRRGDCRFVSKLDVQSGMRGGGGRGYMAVDTSFRTELRQQKLPPKGWRRLRQTSIE